MATMIAKAGLGFESLDFILSLLVADGTGATGTIKLESSLFGWVGSSAGTDCGFGARTGIWPTISGSERGSTGKLLVPGGGATSWIGFGPIS